jgi:hypothetical protein
MTKSLDLNQFFSKAPSHELDELGIQTSDERQKMHDQPGTPAK